MVTNLRLATRLTNPLFADTQPIGWDELHHQFVTEKRWLRRCAAWYCAAKRQQASTVLLHLHDTIEASAALMGLWAAHVHVLWPGVAQAQWIDCAKRFASDVMLAGDFLDLAYPQDKILTVSDHCHKRVVWPSFTLQRPLLYLWTSGSTGKAKCVPKTLTQLFYEARALDTLFLQYCPDLVQVKPIVWSSVTHQHMYGLTFRLLWPLLGNGLLTRTRQHYPESFVRNVQKAPRPPLFITTPTHIERFDDTRLYQQVSCYFIVSSTAPLSTSGVLKCEKALGITPMEILGSTESGILAHRQRKVIDNTVSDALCHPTPMMRLSLSRQNAPYKIGQEGVMMARSLQLNPPQTLLSDRIRVRDVDHRGEITAFDLLGRNDTIVKIEGNRVSCTALSQEIRSIQEAQHNLFDAVWVYLPRGEKRLHAVCVLTEKGQEIFLQEGKNALRQRIQKTLTDKVPAVAIPRFLRFVSFTPMNPQGKTPQRLLHRLFDARRPEWLLTKRRETPQTQRYQWTMTLQPHLRWFAGHFPEVAILPGVATLELVRIAYGEVLGHEVPIAGFRHLKFKKIVRPGMKLILDMEVQGKKATFTWSICPTDGAPTVSAQGQLLLA